MEVNEKRGWNTADVMVEERESARERVSEHESERKREVVVTAVQTKRCVLLGVKMWSEVSNGGEDKKRGLQGSEGGGREGRGGEGWGVGGRDLWVDEI